MGTDCEGKMLHSLMLKPDTRYMVDGGTSSEVPSRTGWAGGSARGDGLGGLIRLRRHVSTVVL